MFSTFKEYADRRFSPLYSKLGKDCILLDESPKPCSMVRKNVRQIT